MTVSLVRTYLTTRLSVRLRLQPSRQMAPDKWGYRSVSGRTIAAHCSGDGSSNKITVVLHGSSADY